MNLAHLPESLLAIEEMQLEPSLLIPRESNDRATSVQGETEPEILGPCKVPQIAVSMESEGEGRQIEVSSLSAESGQE